MDTKQIRQLADKFMQAFSELTWEQAVIMVYALNHAYKSSDFQHAYGEFGIESLGTACNLIVQ